MKLGPQLPPGIRRLLAARLAVPLPVRAGARQRRACLFKVDRIGDFVLALGALRQLVRHYGPDGCRLVVSQVVAPLAAAEFPDVPRWEVPPEASGVWREIRPLRRRLAPAWAEETFTDLVCLRHPRSTWRDVSLQWIHAATWQGLDVRPEPKSVCASNHPQFPPDYPAVAAQPWCRELAAHRLVVERATNRPADWNMIRPRLQSLSTRAGGDWVFCPFGGSELRDYPADHWVAAWRHAALPNAPVHVLGPRSRTTDLERLAARLRSEANHAEVAVATDLPLPEFVRRIGHSRGVITVESAAAHLATALDKPAVVVTGGGHFGRFAPWGDGVIQHWVTHSLDCFGCDWHCRHPQVRCLTELPAVAVADALRALSAHA